MKKILTIAASAALLLAGCAKNELAPSAVEAETGSGVITFTTYTGRAVTKAGTNLNQSFNVEAFLTSTKAKYFDATDYTYASGNYTGAVTHYWPLSGSLDFYAVSPLKYRNTSGNDVTLAVSDSTFTVTATDGRTDIVAAKKTSQAKVDAVALQFGHKLTKVCFKAVGADTTKTYKIDSIKVTANSTGKYNYSPTESWSDAGTSYSYSFLKTRKTIPAKTKNATAVGDTLYLIPSQGASVKAKISYTVFEGATKIDSTATPIEVDLPAGIWGINKSIAYVLTLNFTSSASPITFSATTGEWDGDTEVAVNPVFSVSSTKKVKFTKGNLYWDGSAFHLEANQYGVASTWSTSHVSHFYWTTTAAASYTQSYQTGSSDGNMFCDGSDNSHKLTVDNQSGLYVLSSNEWHYLLNYGNDSSERNDANRYAKAMVNGIKGLLVFPDGYNGITSATGIAAINGRKIEFPESSIPTDTWMAMEYAGVIFLPVTGRRDGTAINQISSASNPYSLYYCAEGEADAVPTLNFGPSIINAGSGLIAPAANTTAGIRLVYDAE